MNETSKEIRITQCSRFGWWYEENIGEVFGVTGEQEDNYEVVYPGNKTAGLSYHVLKVDCEPFIPVDPVPVPPPALSARERALVEAARQLLQDIKPSLDGDYDLVCLVCGDYNGHAEGCAYAELESAMQAYAEPTP